MPKFRAAKITGLTVLTYKTLQLVFKQPVIGNVNLPRFHKTEEYYATHKLL